MKISHEDVKVLPLATVGVLKGVLEVYVVPTYETYKPKNVEEVIETAGLVAGLAGLAIAGYAMYQEFSNGTR